MDSHNDKSYLFPSAAKKICTFVVQVENPLETVERLAGFFNERKIIVETFHMHRYRDGDATLIVHCQIEKDRIFRTAQLLEKLPGITKMERLEGR